MDMRLVAAPNPGRIVLRSALRGGCFGAAAGLLPLIALVPATQGAALIFSPIAIVIGFAIGVGCGLTGGLALAAVRTLIVASRTAVRLTAAAGASAGPAAYTVAALVGGGHLAAVVALGVLVVTFGLAFAGGTAAFYGKPDGAGAPSAVVH